jgi:hypothetical protein
MILPFLNRSGDSADAYLAATLTEDLQASLLRTRAAALGARDEALWWLERFRPRRDSHFQMHLRLDPPLDPLRSDPQFRALLFEDK